MHRRAELVVVIPTLLLLLLLLLSLSNPQHAPQPHDISHHFCHRTSSASDGLTRLTFLRETTTGVGHRRSLLYQSMWSEEDMQLVSCSISDDPAVTESYLTLCVHDGTTDTPGQVDDRFNISLLLAADYSPCALKSSSGGLKLTKPRERIINWVYDPQLVVKSRRKRSWMFPGTLWCGTGSKANGYEQLGMFESADKCCREHDHCKSTIHAFRVNYGVFNPNFYTVSHCDCDQRFRQCLHSVNDPISSMVGYSFFNILRVPCFHVVRQRRCIEMYWWGMCKVAREAPYAVFQKPMPYTGNYTSVASKYDVTGADHKSIRTKARDGMERPQTSQNRNPPKGEHRKPSVSSGRCIPRVLSRANSSQWKKRKGKGCKRSSKASATATSAPSTRTPTSMLQTTATLTSQAKTAVTAAASKFNKTVSNGNKSGKNKGSRMKHKGKALSQATIEPRQKAATPQSFSPMALITFTTATTITTTGKKRQRCGPKLPVRGDTFQSRRKPCADPKTTSHTSTAKVSSTEKTSAIFWNSTTTNSITTTITDAITDAITSFTTTSTTSTNTTTTPVAQRGNFPKQTNTYPLRDRTNQEMAAIITDNLTLCGTLKHLDDCKHRIQPLEKKYNLQNMESKIVYHCDCTSRLAGQIENFRMPTILRSLLVDFVSENCLNLPNGKNCLNRKSSCAAGFSKASSLFQALKKIEERSTAGDQKLNRDVKRAIPVRLYKRCRKILHPRKKGRA